MDDKRIPARSKFLAHGAAAEVWLIDAPNPAGGKCVLKIIRLNLETLKENYGLRGSRRAVQLWEDFTRVFRSKVDQWKPLLHINVVRVLDLNEGLDLKVDYLAGGNASQYLVEHPHDSIIPDVLAGLSYLHSQNPPVVHGCIRMDKLFVGADGTTKIGEFGLAALLGDFEFFAPSVSQVGQVRWMSPELLQANTDQRPQPTTTSDVWALGCTLFEITSGKLPYFKYKHDLRVRHEIASKKSPGLRENLLDLDFADVWPIITSCWVWDPEQRPSIKELVQSSRRPVESAPDDPTPQESRAMGRSDRSGKWEATNKLSQIPDGGPILPQVLQNVKSGSWGKQGEATQHTDSHLQMSDTSRKVDEEMGANAERREAVSTIQVAETSATMEATKRLVIFKRCPAPTVVYTGRDDENTKVIACITGGKDERRVCVVYGFGGVGKTQLALNVVERTWDEWDHIIYVDAGSTEALEKSLKEFAEVNGLGKSYKDAINWLESCGKRWLVVFDNADTPSTNLQQYIPVRGRGGSVLITTRLPDLARLAVGPESVYCLSSMSPADGTALLVKIASSRNQGLSDKDTEAAEELVKEFGYLALAIVHAGAFIAHSPGMTIPKYRSLFTSQRQRMLEEYKQLPEMAKLDERGDTAYTTWKMCYDQLKPESRELLWLIAYLHYYGISEEIFKRAAQNMQSKTYPLPPTDTETQARDRVQKYLSHFMDSGNNWDTVKFVGVMADLTSYSLIEFDRMNLTYRVYVLVHDWAKTTVPHSPELAVECTATVLSLSIDREEDAESLAFKRQLGLHVASVLIQNPDLGANHGCYFTEVYSCTGQWVQKAKLEQKLQAVFQQELGDDHFQTWSVVHRFASTCRGLGQWEKALDLQTQVVDAYKELLGEEDPDTLTSMSDLALTYSHLGQYDNAQQLQVQVLDIRKRMLGEEHPHTLTSMGNLALTYVRLGRYDEAEQLEAQVLDIRKHVLGEEHPDTLTSISHLASACLCLGRYDKAEKLETQVLDTRKRVLGEEHPQTLASMGNLASVYVCLGRYHEAEQLEAQVFDMRKHVLGEEHPDTLISMSNLASTYSNLGQYNNAEQLEARVLDIRKRMLGEEHLDTLTSMSDLASIHLRLGRYENAQQLEAWVLDRRKRVLGEEHPSTLTSMRNLASTYSHLGQYDSAQQLQVQILDVSKRMLGKEHLDTLVSMKDLASTYSHLGRYNDAEQLQVQVLDICKQILGEKHPNTLVSMSDLASTYTGLGRYGDAEQLQVQVLDMRKHVLGEEHPHTLLSMNNLASTFSDLGRYNDAEQLQVQVIEMCKRTLGEEHPSTLASMNNLAATYSSLGQWGEAKELFNHAISLAERTLGSQHPRTQLYHDNLESMQTRRNTEMKKTV